IPKLRTIVEVAPMADNRTMEELLQAPTEGYEEAIIISEIKVDHFEVKTNLLQLLQANSCHGFERENLHPHINNFKRITSTLKFRDVPNDVIRLMMFPNSLEEAARVCNQPSICAVMSTYNQVAPQNRASNYMAPPGFAPVQNSQNRLNDQKLRKKATNQMEKFFQIFQDLQFDISFADALLLMPKFASTIKSLLTNKDKLFKLAKIPLNENCSVILLKKLLEKLGDPGEFLIPCDFSGMDVCHALADLGVSLNLMPLSILKKLSLPELTPTKMTLELADRSITHPNGVAEYIFVKVGKFHFLTDFVVIDFEANPRVPLILGRSFLSTDRALIDVYREEITLRVNDEAVTFNLNQTMGYSSTYDDLSDFILEEIEAYLKDESSSPKIDHVDCDPEGDIFLIEKLLNNDPFQLPSMDLKQGEVVKEKSSIKEPPELKIKDLPSHLEYAYLEEILGFSNNSLGGNPTSTSEPILSDSYPSLNPFERSDFILEEIEAYLKDESSSPKIDHVDCDPEGDICLIEKLLNNDPFRLPSMDLKQGEVVKEKSSIKEPPELEIKDLPSHLEYAYLEGVDKLPVIIAKDLKDNEKEVLLKVLKSHKRASAWKITDNNGINPRFCTHKILMEEDYKPAVQCQRRVNPKIHEVIKKEVIKLLDARMIYLIFDSPWVSPIHCIPKKGGITLVENENNELIPTRLVTGWRVCIDYRKLNDATRKDHFPLPFMDQIMPFGLCNAPGTFQRCMMAIFYDMIEKTMEVFMDEFLVFGDSFSSCISHLDTMLQRHEFDRAKVNVIAKLPHLTTVKGDCIDAFETLKKKLTEAPILVVPDWNLPFELMCDASDFAIGAVLGQHFANFHAGNFIVKGMSSQQKKKFFKDVKHYFWDDPYLFGYVRIISFDGVCMEKKLMISSKLVIKDLLGAIMVPISPPRKYLISVSFGQKFIEMLTT
nr:reverse transcriptase domain-containing protein [Tanacetum cinerariifolium]